MNCPRQSRWCQWENSVSDFLQNAYEITEFFQLNELGHWVRSPLKNWSPALKTENNLKYPSIKTTSPWYDSGQLRAINNSQKKPTITFSSSNFIHILHKYKNLTNIMLTLLFNRLVCFTFTLFAFPKISIPKI